MSPFTPTFTLGLRWPVIVGALLVIVACAWIWRIRAQTEAALPREAVRSGH